MLAQGLNALGIPARGVHALRNNYDRPVTSMGHVVVEAWIEDLDHWVVLDPQNRAYWCDQDRPLSAVELWRRYCDGASRPEFRLVDGQGAEASEPELWWSHWASVGVGHSALVDDGGFSAIFQGRWPLGRRRLLTEPALCYPRLSSVEVSVTGTSGGAIGLNVTANHPYATGLEVNGTQYESTTAFHPFTLKPGAYGVTISAMTRWNHSAQNDVTYRAADQST